MCAIARQVAHVLSNRADAPAIIPHIVTRHLRLSPLVAVLLAASALPAGAQAAELYAAPGGGGSGCAVAAAPCTLNNALAAARSAPGADVLNLASGTYVEVVEAASAADTDVTIRGAGIGATIIAAPATDRAMVQLGFPGSTGSMVIENLTVDATSASPTVAALRSRLAKLTLTRVRVVQSGAAVKEQPAIDADALSAELILDGVEVLANTQTIDSSYSAVNVGGPFTMRDSTITHTSNGDSSAVYARGNVTILRSTISHGEANLGQPLRYANPLAASTIVIDSSVLTGGSYGARFDVGALATTATLRGVTIAPYVTGSGHSVWLNGTGTSLARATVSSSLLVGRSVRVNNGAQTTCTFTNLPTTGSSGSPNCPAAGASATAAGNTGLATAALKLGTDLVPAADSPAIDSGDSAGVSPGESATDRLGRTRAGASADACEAGPGRRDKGAFERYRPRPAVAINGPDTVAPGVAATFAASVTAKDPAYAWSFGDGATGGVAASATHAFALGASSVTLTVTDRAYNCSTAATKAVTSAAPAGGGPGGSADKTAPKISAAKLTKSSVARGKSVALRFSLSEAASVTVTVGRIKGKKLVSPRKLTVKGKRGVNKVTLSAKKLKLRRGRYGLRIGAKDAAGNAAKTVALTLRVR